MAEQTITQAFDLASRHHQAGRLQDAERIYRQILSQRPEHTGALHSLGFLAHQVARHDIALDLIRRALVLNPKYIEAHITLGNVLTHTGQFDQAIAAYQQAISLRPDFAVAYSNLGNALEKKGRVGEAITACRRAIAINPTYAKAHSNLGVALHRKGELDNAIVAFRRALQLAPALPEIHCNLANALHDAGRLDEAIIAFGQAISLNPNLAEAHGFLGNALRNKGNLSEAVAACERAIALNPNFAEAHFNLSLALLAMGNFHRGWDEYEWRWRCRDIPSPLKSLSAPQWDGSPLQGRILLIHTEQGHGDAIQFIRYLPRVIQQGGQIILACRRELHRLFQRIAADCQIIALEQRLPHFDLHCPLVSLARLFQTNLGNIPRDVPYLKADAADSAKWHARLGGDSSILKVGLAWAGSPGNKNDRNRSIKLATFAPLAQVSGARFFSLQKGDASAEAKTPPPGMELVDWTAELNDFADTAALIANLDLVISVDTAVAHLAGAMAKPVWTLLSFVADWRWLLERNDSVWYPTMRLFRQPAWGDWQSVMTNVAAELLKLRGPNT